VDHLGRQGGGPIGARAAAFRSLSGGKGMGGREAKVGGGGGGTALGLPLALPGVLLRTGMLGVFGLQCRHFKSYDKAWFGFGNRCPEAGDL
jgi:uncharacterized membrane protein